jgi:hypothetical protein
MILSTLFQARRARRIARIHLHSLLILRDRIVVLLHRVEGHGFALVALRPGGVDLDALVSVLFSFLVVADVLVGGGAVAEDGVVCGVLLCSLTVKLDGFLVFLVLERLGSLFFERHILLLKA